MNLLRITADEATLAVIAEACFRAGLATRLGAADFAEAADFGWQRDPAVNKRTGKPLSPNRYISTGPTPKAGTVRYFKTPPKGLEGGSPQPAEQATEPPAEAQPVEQVPIPAHVLDTAEMLRSMSKQDLTDEKMAELQTMLAGTGGRTGWSVADLKALKEKLGVSAYGNKSEMAQRIIAGAKKNAADRGAKLLPVDEPPPAGPAISEPPPAGPASPEGPVPSELANQIMEALARAPVTDLAELRRSLPPQYQGKDFDRAILQLADEDRLQLAQDVPTTRWSDEQRGQYVAEDSVENGAIYTTAMLKDRPAPQAEAPPAAEAPPGQGGPSPDDLHGAFRNLDARGDNQVRLDELARDLGTTPEQARRLGEQNGYYHAEAEGGLGGGPQHAGFLVKRDRAAPPPAPPPTPPVEAMPAEAPTSPAASAPLHERIAHLVSNGGSEADLRSAMKELGDLNTADRLELARAVASATGRSFTGTNKMAVTAKLGAWMRDAVDRSSGIDRNNNARPVRSLEEDYGPQGEAAEGTSPPKSPADLVREIASDADISKDAVHGFYQHLDGLAGSLDERGKAALLQELGGQYTGNFHEDVRRAFPDHDIPSRKQFERDEKKYRDRLHEMGRGIDELSRVGRAPKTEKASGPPVPTPRASTPPAPPAPTPKAPPAPTPKAGPWSDHPVGKDEPTPQDIEQMFQDAIGKHQRRMGGWGSSAMYDTPDFMGLKDEVPQGVDANAVLDAIHETAGGLSGYRTPSLEMAYKAASAAHPGLTVRQFQETLKALAREGKVSLQPYTRPRHEAEQSGENRWHFVADSEIKGYVRPTGNRPDRPSPAPPATPPAEADSPAPERDRQWAASQQRERGQSPLPAGAAPEKDEAPLQAALQHFRHTRGRPYVMKLAEAARKALAAGQSTAQFVARLGKNVRPEDARMARVLYRSMRQQGASFELLEALGRIADGEATFDALAPFLGDDHAIPAD